MHTSLNTFLVRSGLLSTSGTLFIATWQQHSTDCVILTHMKGLTGQEVGKSCSAHLKPSSSLGHLLVLAAMLVFHKENWWYSGTLCLCSASDAHPSAHDQQGLGDVRQLCDVHDMLVCEACRRVWPRLCHQLHPLTYLGSTSGSASAAECCMMRFKCTTDRR